MDALDNLLRCPICFDFYHLAVIIPNCSHNYCSFCIRQHFQQLKHYCPICKKASCSSELKNNRLLDEIVAQYKLCQAAAPPQPATQLFLLTNGDNNDVNNNNNNNKRTPSSPGDSRRSKRLNKSTTDVISPPISKLPARRGARKSAPASTRTNNNTNNKEEEEADEDEISVPSTQPAVIPIALPKSTTVDLNTITPISKRRRGRKPKRLDDYELDMDGLDSNNTSTNSNTSSTNNNSSQIIDDEDNSLNQSTNNNVNTSQSPSKNNFASYMNSPSQFNQIPSSQQQQSTQSTLTLLPPPEKVQCPNCKILVINNFLATHMNICTSKTSLALVTTPSLKPVPKLVYNIMSQKQIKESLKKIGLRTNGDKQTMINRHREYTLRHNSECDSLNPRPVQEIIDEVHRNEDLILKPTKKRAASLPNLSSIPSPPLSPPSQQYGNTQNIDNNISQPPMTQEEIFDKLRREILGRPKKP